ncbi:MAG: hypothetical protein H7Y09_04525 [Chitinophagaceae bacterium]|nr:hypothetical protein [Anaerolineae bacterium]
MGLDLHEHGAFAYPDMAFLGNDGTPKSLEEIRRTKGIPNAAPGLGAD